MSLRERALQAVECTEQKRAADHARLIERAVDAQRQGAIDALRSRLNIESHAWEWTRGEKRLDGYHVPTYDWHFTTPDGIEFVWHYDLDLYGRSLRVVHTCTECGGVTFHRNTIQTRNALTALGYVLRDLDRYTCPCKELVRDALETADIEAHTPLLLEESARRRAAAELRDLAGGDAA